MWKRGEVFLPEVRRLRRDLQGLQRAGGARAARQEGPDAEANALVLMCSGARATCADLGETWSARCCETSGFDVHDIGEDVNADRIMAAIDELAAAEPRACRRCSPRPSPRHQETVIEKLVAAGRARPREDHGGPARPVTPEWAEKIERKRRLRDDAPEAVEIARRARRGSRSGRPSPPRVLSGPGGGEVRSRRDERPFAMIGRARSTHGPAAA